MEFVYLNGCQIYLHELELVEMRTGIDFKNEYVIDTRAAPSINVDSNHTHVVNQQETSSEETKCRKGKLRHLQKYS